MAVDGQVVIRPMKYLALSYESPGGGWEGPVTFLAARQGCNRNPVRLLLEV